MWTVLRSFESEPEARVVEAFLKAHQIDVQLLGTHSHAGAVAPGSLKTAAMRMMVRQDQVPAAKELLKEAESRAHLSVVNEGTTQTSKKQPGLLWLIVIGAMVLVAALTYFKLRF